jgi:murein L,D-transpeptidase YafK
MWLRRGILGATAAAVVSAAGLYAWRQFRGPADLAAVRRRLAPVLTADLAVKGLSLGAPIFIRIFKEPGELEVWVRSGARFDMFRTYPICNFSGGLGPKLREGDGQSPEGFYFVTPDRMNPASSYHLSFNLGFPNAYDRAHGRTGSFLMVHGDCVSVGCYAMTDSGIEEIYLMAESALAGGQPFFRVHAFPFRLTDANLARHAGSPWSGFWQNLREGYDIFERERVPPEVAVKDGDYVFAARGEGLAPG